MGNTTSARLDYVRPVDVEHFQNFGTTWVRRNGRYFHFRSTRNSGGPVVGAPCRLDYGNLLLVWNDHAHHWSWEPAQDMALATYQGLLAQAYLAFIRRFGAVR
jgi:hypothetical protein